MGLNYKPLNLYFTVSLQFMLFFLQVCVYILYYIWLVSLLGHIFFVKWMCSSDSLQKVWQLSSWLLIETGDK